MIYVQYNDMIYRGTLGRRTSTIQYCTVLVRSIRSIERIYLLHTGAEGAAAAAAALTTTVYLANIYY